MRVGGSKDERVRAGGAHIQAGRAMRGALGAGGGALTIHVQLVHGIDFRSFTAAGALKEAVRPPSRYGELNPEPCRPLGRQGGPASGCNSCVHRAKPSARLSRAQ